MADRPAGPDAVETALRALRFRDRTTAELDARLEQRGVGEAEREVGGRVALISREAVEVGEQALTSLVAIIGILDQQAVDDCHQRR